MVVLEAAAIGAASYGLYKGGEAGVKKGKECKREMKRDKRRSSQRSSLREKIESRRKRSAEIVQMKKNGGTNTNTGGTTGKALAFDVAEGASTKAPVSFIARQKAEKEADSSVDDRHRNVMQKLRSSRREERKKGTPNYNILLSLNPFKKK